MATAHDSDPDLEASSSSPLLPTSSSTSSARANKRVSSGKDWYHRLYLDYLSTAGLVLVLALWLFGWTSDSGRSEDGSPKGDASWPTRIGFEGPTPTGSEPLAAATAYPVNYDSSPLRPPSSLEPSSSSDFDLLANLGNLSPWRTVSHGVNASAQVPDGCKIEQVQLLHRHGARYPTSGAGPADFASKIVGNQKFKAHGNLSFLNDDWTYKLGAEVLTPFGREQLFNLGVSFRTKYGALLDAPPLGSSDKPKKRSKPVFRTETQDRMLKSALNFAAGFFGIPFEEQYHQLITIEWPGYNNTLSPYMTCKNANRPDLTVGPQKVGEWLAVYLAPALKRIQAQVEGIELTLVDVFNMQLMCAYEVVALGGSEFCTLFTPEEWEGHAHALDLSFFYTFSFGQPAQAALGLGWVQEWLARVDGRPLEEFNSTTNATYHSAELFPLDQALYVDATHDTIISAVIVTLNFASFTASGAPPSTHIPKHRSFVTSSISPFAANLHSQIVTCPDRPRQVRWVLNDGVVPLSHIEGCDDDPEGFCDLDKFLKATKERTSKIDWANDCLAPYKLAAGDEILDGQPLRRR